MQTYGAMAIVLLAYLVLTWFVGSWLRLQGANLWLVRGGLTAIGLIGAGVFLWFHRKLKGAQSEGIEPVSASTGTEIDLLLQQADQKLKTARQLSGATLRTLPVIFILGESSSAKTSSILHSGLDPDLLAGVVYRETEVLPTNALNIWYARGTVFIEIGRAAAGSTRLWTRILEKTTGSGVASALGKGECPPRAVVLCCDGERLQAGGEKLLATARRLGSQLQTMANVLRARFPFYVLFTKLDQLPKFTDFVSNLTPDEAKQVLGATISQRDPSQGIFADEEKIRLGKEFDQLLYSLAAKRIDYLRRENSPSRLPGVYEFPREFGKVRDQILAFLVELSRPTQLGTNPFLRGFYFSGVRPVMIHEKVAAPAPLPAKHSAPQGATQVLSPRAIAQATTPGAQVQTVRSRKVADWTFLPHLFGDVILRDRAALGTSSNTARPTIVRRILLVTITVFFLCASIAFLISFLNNRSLQQDVADAEKGLAATAQASADAANTEQLRQLDRLRGVLSKLEANARDGAPFSYRFGLYDGDRLYPEARRIYFGYFERLLLSPTEAAMVTTLRHLPDVPRAEDTFREPYDVLKAYLITTVRHDQSSQQFLVPVLLRLWSDGKGIDAERRDLARAQFDYYSQALIPENPYALDSDTGVVGHARSYLKQFNGIEPVYQSMLSAASKGNQGINFNRQFPGSERVIINSYEVPGAFTKNGFAAMQRLLQNPEVGGEEWVMGEVGSANMNKEALERALRSRYYGDLVNHWRTFLRQTRIVPYASLKDASSKLQVLSANDSPLLQLLHIVEKNTSIDLPEVANAFQPVVVLAKNSTDQVLITPANQPYMSKLLGLQGSVNTLTMNSAPQPDTGPVLSDATAAKNTVGIIAQSFRIDNEGHVDSTVKKLMEDPITYVESLAGKAAPAALNGAGKSFCEQYNALAHKYPFSTSPIEATLQDVATIFQPGSGALWTFYAASLKNSLIRQGSQFAMSPAATMRISPEFIRFMNHAAAISEELYPAGSEQPHFNYVLKQLPSKGIDQLTLTIDGQSLTGTGNTQQFAWTGNPGSTVQLKGSYSGGNLLFPSFQGLWSAFHFMQRATWVGQGPTYTLEWPMEVAGEPVRLSDGTPVVIRYELDAGAQAFRPESLGMRCPPLGAR